MSMDADDAGFYGVSEGDMPREPSMEELAHRALDEARDMMTEAEERLGPETPGIPDQDSPMRSVVAKLKEAIRLSYLARAQGDPHP